MVFAFLFIIILASMTYLILTTCFNGLSTLLFVETNAMFNILYRRPFGPMGYYAMGILGSIFYYEYTYANSVKYLHECKAFLAMNYI